MFPVYDWCLCERCADFGATEVFVSDDSFSNTLGLGLCCGRVRLFGVFGLISVVCLLSITDHPCTIGLSGVLFSFGVLFLRMMGEVCSFDVVGFVILRVANLPAFFVWYPFVDSADEPVDGGVGDKIGDDDDVSFLDCFLLSGWRGFIRFVRFGALI